MTDIVTSDPPTAYAQSRRLKENKHFTHPRHCVCSLRSVLLLIEYTMANFNLSLLATVSVAAFFYAAKELLLGGGLVNNFRGRRLSKDPRSNSTMGDVKKNELEFIHITKSGGSAIEAAAAKNNINWGACHYGKIPHFGCDTPDWDFPKKRHVERMPAGFIYQDEPWHAPPHWNEPNMMEGIDSFLVVRNPVRFLLILNVFSCSLYNRLTFYSRYLYSMNVSSPSTTVPPMDTRERTAKTLQSSIAGWLVILLF
jgi:hypothetical protein